MKKIKNIVLYPTWNQETGEREQKAHVFYTNGDVDESISFEDAVSLCEQLWDELELKRDVDFEALIDKDMVHVTTEQELVENWDFYAPKNYKKRSIEKALQGKFDSLMGSLEEEKEEVKLAMEEETEVNEESTEETKELSEKEQHENDIFEEIKSTFEDDKPVPSTPEELQEFSDELNSIEKQKLEEAQQANTKKERSEEEKVEGSSEETALVETQKVDSEQLTFEGIIDEDHLFETTDEESKKSANNIIQRLTSGFLALSMIATAGYATRKMNAEEVDNLKTAFSLIPQVSASTLDREADNSNYNDYSYYELLNVTKDQFQKSSMESLGTSLIMYNGVFADAHKEEGKDIKAALTVEEMIALQLAYNNFDEDELAEYLNGTILDANKLSIDFKNATLQLMGAHVIETRENPVNIVNELLRSEIGKAFYNKYHNMYLDALESSGDDQLNIIEAFYKMVREDFPITSTDRTEGISHASIYESMEPYKLSVIPMIAAAEMLFQNKSIDFTLTDEEAEFFNELGYCNFADAIFRKVETISLDRVEDKSDPTLEQFIYALIDFLKERDQYGIKDEQRDLSKLEAFINRVNNGVSYEGFVYYTGGSVYSVTYQTESHYQKTEYSSTETRESKPMPADVKEEIDSEIAEENAVAKAEGEAEAEEVRKQMQAEEDKKAEQILKEIEERAKDLKDRIAKANEKQKNGEPVNESDFGNHNVQIDPEDKDQNGNLDPSVIDITTDPTGDQTGQSLPDPNVTGADFDAKEPTNTPSNDDIKETSNDGGNGSTGEEPKQEQETGKSWANYINGKYDSQELHQNDDASQQPTEEGYDPSKEASREYYEHWYDQDSGSSYTIEYETDSNATSVSNVNIADEYVNSLDGIELDEDGYQYILSGF